METELNPGAVLCERYEILRTLDRGGFSIAYVALDTLANREVVVKELFPKGSVRTGSSVRLPDGTERAAYQFLREARTLARLRLRGVVNILDAFQESGTAYVVMESHGDAVSLEKVLRSEGAMPPGRVRLIIAALCEALAEIHERGFLHRDIKPSNILLLTGDVPMLIDFGAAREWQADATIQHTTLFTPGYAPIEQLSEKARRSPGSDIYALAATAYEMLSGVAPVSAIDRVAGMALAPIAHTDDDFLIAAIERGLALRANDRPQSASDFRAMVLAQSPTHAVIERSKLEEMDAALAALAKLKTRKSECPACGDLLVEPRPLKPGVCPTCRSGKLRKRVLESNKCAICRDGFVREFANVPLHYCPVCRTSDLIRPGLLKRSLIGCSGCKAEFSNPSKGMLKLQRFGSRRSVMIEEGETGDEAQFWLGISGRARRCAECETCGAQWDVDESVWRLVAAKLDPFGVARQHRSLHKHEWSRLAANLPMDAGNFVCDSCEADYFIDDNSLTLIDSVADPYGFAEENQGRRVELSALPWVGVGKWSGNPGLSCEACDTEFDFDGGYLRLRSTENAALSKRIDDALTLEDWHRASRRLPLVGEQNAFRAEFTALLKESILSGDVAWRDDDARFLSRALLIDGQKELQGELVITDTHFEFLARRVEISAPLDAVYDVLAERDLLTVSLSGDPQPTVLRVLPSSFDLEMESGRYEVTFAASDAASALAISLESARAAREKTSRSV